MRSCAHESRLPRHVDASTTPPLRATAAPRLDACRRRACPRDGCLLLSRGARCPSGRDMARPNGHSAPQTRIPAPRDVARRQGVAASTRVMLRRRARRRRKNRLRIVSAGSPRAWAGCPWAGMARPRAPNPGPRPHAPARRTATGCRGIHPCDAAPEGQATSGEQTAHRVRGGVLRGSWGGKCPSGRDMARPNGHSAPQIRVPPAPPKLGSPPDPPGPASTSSPLARTREGDFGCRCAAVPAKIMCPELCTALPDRDSHPECRRRPVMRWMSTQRPTDVSRETSRRPTFAAPVVLARRAALHHHPSR